MTLTPEQRRANVERMKRLPRRLRQIDRQQLEVAEGQLLLAMTQVPILLRSIREERELLEEVAAEIEAVFAETAEKGTNDDA